MDLNLEIDRISLEGMKCLKANKINCPCCGYYTIDTNDEIIVDICPVCYWQYDEVCHDNPDVVIGPNKVSLNDARKNYKEYKVSDVDFILYVRDPDDTETKI